jgi:hypothetical protein
MKNKSNKPVYSIILIMVVTAGIITISLPWTPVFNAVPKGWQAIYRIAPPALFFSAAMLLYFRHIYSIPFHADQCYSSDFFEERYKFLKHGALVCFIFFLVSLLFFIHWTVIT